MSDIIEFIQSNISAFDLIVFLIIVYSMAQCAAKGFMRSLLSFSKWLLALIITIILVPKLNPWVQDYVESKFISDIGLGVFIYIVSLFVIINIGKAIGSAVTWSGLGTVDKIFGVFFQRKSKIYNNVTYLKGNDHPQRAVAVAKELELHMFPPFCLS